MSSLLEHISTPAEASKREGPHSRIVLSSREHAAKNAGSGLVISKDEGICVMINEEDHLRMQALKPGLQLKEAWQLIDQFDSALEKKLPYAFSPSLGYLTA